MKDRLVTHLCFIKRMSAIGLIIAMITGSISIIAVADTSNPQWEFAVTMSEGRARHKRASDSNRATTSDASELLEQEDNMWGAAKVDWFTYTLQNNLIFDSSKQKVMLLEGQEISSDWTLQYEMRAQFDIGSGQIEDGSFIVWNLGVFPSLSITKDIWNELIIGGISVGEASLSYEADGSLILKTEFWEGIESLHLLNITYRYNSDFIHVDEKTPIDVRLPGQTETVTVYLMPDGSETEATSEETTPEETTPEQTTPEQTTPEETTVEETTTQSVTEPTVKPTRPASAAGDGSYEPSPRPSEAVTALVQPMVTEATSQEPSLAVSIETSKETPKETPKETSKETPKETLNNRENDTTSEATEASESLEVTSEIKVGASIKPGEEITYRFIIQNNGTESVKDIRVRDYIPALTSFSSASEGGSYGIIAGKQHVTWNVPSLEAGEVAEFEMTVKTFYCIPQEYQLKNHMLWQKDDKTAVNDSANPEREVHAPDVIIG